MKFQSSLNERFYLEKKEIRAILGKKTNFRRKREKNKEERWKTKRERESLSEE
jgi:hypothetical protein